MNTLSTHRQQTEADYVGVVRLLQLFREVARLEADLPADNVQLHTRSESFPFT